MILADSHVHLDRYGDDEVDAMLERAVAAGVQHLLTVGSDVASSRRAVAIARRFPQVRAAVGIHPLHLDVPAHLDFDGAIAVGEIGLDGDRPAQRPIFEKCLAMARERDLPVVLHIVDAHETALEILARHPVRGVVHYFQGDAALARRYLDLGLHISVGKPAAAAAHVPLDRLLIETDTYPLPGRTTEPRDVTIVCEAVARLHRVARDVVAEHTTRNFLELFA